MSFEKITKIEAAERQIKEAIRLFFERRDPLSIHTLIGAAHQVLFDISKKHGFKGYLKDDDIIVESKRSEFYKKINEAKNFLKHAETDPDKKLKFNPDINEFWLHDSIVLYLKIRKSIPHEMSVYSAWFMAKYPNLFYEKVKLKLLLGKAIDFDLANDFNLWLELLNSPGQNL